MFNGLKKLWEKLKYDREVKEARRKKEEHGKHFFARIFSKMSYRRRKHLEKYQTRKNVSKSWFGTFSPVAPIAQPTGNTPKTRSLKTYKTMVYENGRERKALKKQWVRLMLKEV